MPGRRPSFVLVRFRGRGQLPERPASILGRCFADVEEAPPRRVRVGA